MLVFSHNDCLLKNNGLAHPENKERLISITNSISKIKDYKIFFKDAPLANLKTISLVHPIKYIEKMFSLIPENGLVSVEEEPYADTMLCVNSKNAILRSCGAGKAAVDNIIVDKNAFCAVRPPGHHAETIRANGFCFINNIAVAANYLQHKYKINRIAIIDFDVHHGNGTQEIFYQRTIQLFMVQYINIPLFPGTGSEEEKGVGNIFNAPIKSGTNGKDFINIFENKILKPIDKFKPEVILISAGFDAHKRDPLANINLESKDFFEITKKIVELANIHSEGRIISFLEGGYDLTALSEGIKEHLDALDNF